MRSACSLSIPAKLSLERLTCTPAPFAGVLDLKFLNEINVQVRDHKVTGTSMMLQKCTLTIYILTNPRVNLINCRCTLSDLENNSNSILSSAHDHYRKSILTHDKFCSQVICSPSEFTLYKDNLVIKVDLNYI